MPKLQQLFGKRLRQIRMSKKLTQDDLARITNLSSSFISTLVQISETLEHLKRRHLNTNYGNT